MIINDIHCVVPSGVVLYKRRESDMKIIALRFDLNEVIKGLHVAHDRLQVQWNLGLHH